MEYSEYPEEQYKYEELLTETSFRVCELLLGKGDDPISCLLHVVDWDKPREYEAISYAWGDPTVGAPVNVHGKVVDITVNLHTSLRHLRSQDESRYLWANALCTNQNNIPERGCQVAQMRKIYENATRVLIWLGPDTIDQRRAKIATEKLHRISDFLCKKLGISIESLDEYGDVYQEVIFKNRSKLPLPDEVESTTDTTWDSLVWFYSHPYFSRVWVIQEINANRERLLHCGNEKII